MSSSSDGPHWESRTREYHRKFTSEILCADDLGDGILVGTTSELCYIDKATDKWSSLIPKRSFKQLDVQENHNILVTLSGKKQRIRVYNLSWLRDIYLKRGTITKRVGWTDIGELMECSGFKIVNYEKLMVLAIAMHNCIELYAWAPNPYHKFMEFRSYPNLCYNPEIMNIFVPEGRKFILVYGSRQGFQSIDTDTAKTYDLISYPQTEHAVTVFAITAVPDSNQTEIILHYKYNKSTGVCTGVYGTHFPQRNIVWEKELNAVADVGYGLLIGLGYETCEIRDAKTGNLQRSQINKRLEKDCTLLFANFEQKTSYLEIWFASRRHLYSIIVPFEHRKVDDTVLATEIKKLGLETAENFAEMIAKGSYRCYWNRLYFVGPYNVGKTTLAKLLVGDPIPEKRKSTDGIWLYIGRAGMDMEKRKWVFLPKGTRPNATVMNMLMTMQNEGHISSTAANVDRDSLEDDEEDELSEVALSLGRFLSQSKAESDEACADPDPVIDINMDDCIGNTLHAVAVDRLETQTPTGILQDKLEVVTSNADIYELVIATYEKGQFKMKVVPIDIWDFGGQKDYYMTHQLFISSRGTYVIIFNGSVDLHKAMPGLSNLPGHSGNMTTAVYLVHWVNSILTYCRKTSDGYPKILFVATHKDLIWKSRIEKERKKLMEGIDDLFSSHAGQKHLQYRPLIFVDARTPFDNEIEVLKKRLFDIAVSHPRWGELMPTTWVPLELEIAEQVQKGLNIISREQLESLNTENKASTMNAKQLNTFLKVQHSLGRLLYFDEENLKDFIVINPIYLIQVLRSIVTEKHFWPHQMSLQETFKKLQKHGVLRKTDLFNIWCQEEFLHVEPYKGYMVDMLVHLDILVEPKSPFLQTDMPQVEYFFVPCIITERNNTSYLRKFCTQDKSIHMAYTFIGEVIPPALSYRFIGSFVGMWNLKWYKETQMLFTDNAVVSVDQSHDLSVILDGSRLVVALIHQTNKKNIAPTIAASVQECLTSIIFKISEFYYSASDDGTTPQDRKTEVMNIPFEIEFGVNCKDGVCFYDSRLISHGQHSTWTCPKHGKENNTSFLNLWFAEKKAAVDCDQSCTGLGKLELDQCPTDQHLRRLASSISLEKTYAMFIYYGLTHDKWQDLQYQYRYPDDLKFFAFWKWKQCCNSSFQELKRVLEETEGNVHTLCEVFRDVTLDTKLSDDTLLASPSSEELESLSNHIGNDTVQLGIELGFEISELQSIERKHKFDLIKQTEDILKKWKKRGQCLLVLGKALYRIGRINCLEQCFH